MEGTTSLLIDAEDLLKYTKKGYSCLTIEIDPVKLSDVISD